jgi:hypothetical protein
MRAKYSGDPRTSSTSNLAMTVVPISVAPSTPSASPSTARAKVSTTELPSCPRSRDRRTLTGSPITSRPSTPHITSPSLTRPAIAIISTTRAVGFSKGTDKGHQRGTLIGVCAVQSWKLEGQSRPGVANRRVPRNRRRQWSSRKPSRRILAGKICQRQPPPPC